MVMGGKKKRENINETTWWPYSLVNVLQCVQVLTSNPPTPSQM